METMSLAMMADKFMVLAEQNTVDGVVRPTNGDMRFSPVGCDYYQTASHLRTAADIAEAITNFPLEKFNVFKHAMDNEGTIRIDIRREGTYSPFCWGDYSEARAKAKSDEIANIIAAKFNEILQHAGKLA